MSRPVNVAVVGLGFMGVTHLRNYLSLPGAKLGAVCDAVRLPVNGVLQGVAGNVTATGDLDLGRDVKVFRKLEEVLADPEIDLVDLCTPTPLHPEQAMAALRAGKHVLCEKPLARTSSAAREIIAVARTSSGFLMPAMCMRFWPGWSLTKEIVDKATYGKVQAARFRRVTEMPGWSKQGTYSGGATDLGGALYDLHIHDTDFVQFLFGRPASVYSTGVTSRSGGPIDHVVTQYNYPGGPIVHAEGGWLLAKGFSMGYTLHCERATIDYDMGRGAEALHIIEAGKDPRPVQADGDGYTGEISYMIDCIRSQRRPEIVTGEDGVSSLEICEAEEKSIRSGQVVPV